MKYPYVTDMLLVAAVISSLVAQAYCGCDNSSSRFNRDPMFDDVILTDNRIAVINGTSTEWRCGLECTKLQDCMSFSYNVDGTCLLYSVKFSQNANSDPSIISRHYYLEKEDVIATDCPVDDGFVLMDSAKICFKVFTKRMAYDEARDNCSRMGYRLIVLDSDEKNTAVSDYISTNTDGILVFIGLTDEAVPGEFVWANGNPISFTKWGPNEPQGQGCVTLQTSVKQWYVGACLFELAYVCEMPI